MNSAESILKANNGGEITALLNQYLLNCRTSSQKEEEQSAKKKERKDSVFPNIAGFCRFIGISTSELERFGRVDPEQYAKILTVLEDEALNSNLSPALISAYLKKRLGYDGAKAQESTSQLEIKFEHDIFEDGE